ncbi:MAG: hypothetical protein LBF74_07185 [Treponema sp.]|jgi:hypothetical protein|nr:hypothetical protein [Treponema sp.]
MKETLKKQKAETIAGRLVDMANHIRFGCVSVNLKIHDGRIVDVTHTVTESTRDSDLREEKA